MSYRLEVTRDARGEIKALPGYVRAQARKLIRALGYDPRPLRAKELRGKPNIYRIWLAGRWRVAYAIDDENRTVHVLRVRRKKLMDYESLDGSSYIHEEGPSYGQSDTPPPLFQTSANASFFPVESYSWEGLPAAC